MSKILLALSAVLLLGAASPVFAQTPPAQDAKFAQRKQVLLANIGSRIALLQQTQTCIQGAADQPALHGCQEQAKAAWQAFRQQKKAK